MEDSHLISNVFEISEIRKNALRSISQGAVTSDYALDLKEACDQLNEALASEILCVLRYRHHQVAVKGIDFPQIQAQFKEHAESEEKHMMMIAERISQLGGEPDFNPANVARRAATEYGSATDVLSMIREDLIAERIVIEVYRKYIAWFGNDDSTTRRMLEEILADEEEHADEMANLLTKTKLFTF